MPPKNSAPWSPFLPLVMLLLLLTRAVSAGAPPDFDVQAHRGGRDRRPENTLAAFRYAIELGVNTLELDTAVTRDRVVVVRHDPRLNPELTRDSGGFISVAPPVFIKDLSLVELKSYTVGQLKPRSSYFYKHREQQPVPGERIPTLEEVFELADKFGAQSIRFNIEIKTYPPHPGYTIEVEEFVDLVLSLISKYGLAGRVTIQSFDWRSLRRVQEKAPAIEIACLTVKSFSIDGASYNLQPGRPGASLWLAGLDYDEFENAVALVAAFGADIISPYRREIKREDVLAAHRAGLRIIPWTVNNRTEMKKFIEWGVDGIITDKPDILKNLLEPGL